MKYSKKVFALIMTVAMVFTMSFATVGVSAATKKATTVKVGAYTVNTAKKTVSFKVTVNGDMLNGAAVSHFIINDVNGKNNTGNTGKGLFSTKGTALDLYKALVKAGATPWVSKTATPVGSLAAGEKLADMGTANKGFPGFSRLEMSFTDKDGYVYKPADLVEYQYNGEGTAAADPFQMCFTGNYKNQEAWNTGCVACLFSCYAGVTSNMAIGCGTTSETENYFYGGSTLKAGDTYTVTYKVKKAPYNYITAKQLKNNMSDYKVLDVREVADCAKDHIKGAYAASVPGGKVDSYDGRANLKAAVKKFGKDKKYVLCCYSGNKYAKAATEILTTRCGVKASNVYTLVGGFNNWKTQYPYQYGQDGNIMVDPVKKTVTLSAYVNGTIHMNDHPDQTHHFVVNENGSNGDKCVFPTEAKPLDVYEAMCILGTPENNSTNLCEASHESGQFLNKTGSPIKVTVSWNKKTTTKKDGKKVTKTTKVTKTMAQCLKRLNGQAYDDSGMEFAGCEEMYRSEFGTKINKSGCITCTFSCWIGTVSNNLYGYNSEEVMPNRNVLPKAGTAVTVTYQF